MCYFIVLFFFFKQKTAYEMRISDWSSDVCSSDLSPTLEKSASPVNTAIIVPSTMASKMDSREIDALPILLSRNTMTRVMPARPIFATLPKSGARELPPLAQCAATGIRAKPMMVMTDPVTLGVKNLMLFRSDWHTFELQ